MGFTKFSILFLVCVAVANADTAKIKTAMTECKTVHPPANAAAPTCPELKAILMCSVEKSLAGGMDVIASAEDFKTEFAAEVAKVSGLVCVQAVDETFVKETITQKCKNDTMGELESTDEEKCAKVKKIVLCHVAHMKMGMSPENVKEQVTTLSANMSLTDCEANTDFLREAVMKKCEAVNAEGADKCAKQFMCAAVDRPAQDKDLKMAAEGLLEKIKAKKDCASADLKVDTGFLQKAVTSRKLGECLKKDDPAAGTDAADKCTKLKDAVKCSIGDIGQGYDLLKMKDGFQTKMEEEAKKLKLEASCAKDFVGVDAIQGAVEEKCKSDETADASDATEDQKCEKIKKRMGCVGASMVKKENLNLAFIKDNFMSLITKVKDAATKEKLTDCKTSTLEFMTTISSAYKGDAAIAQVSFVSLAMALTAAVMLR